jgi:DNA-binding transcriptional ArsR family regulator
MASKARKQKGMRKVKVDPLDRVPRPKIKKRAKLEPVEERLMKALSHPLRVQILTLVNERPWSPNEMSKELDEGLSQVSYHVKVLRDFELIELTKTEPRRGAVEHYYKAVERTFVREKIADKLPRTAQMLLRDRIIQDADRDIQEALEAGTFYQRKDIHADWAPMDLDDRACKALSKRADEFLEDALKIESDAATRIAEGAESIPMSLTLFAFVSARVSGAAPEAQE